VRQFILIIALLLSACSTEPTSDWEGMHYDNNDSVLDSDTHGNLHNNDSGGTGEDEDPQETDQETGEETGTETGDTEEETDSGDTTNTETDTTSEPDSETEGQTETETDTGTGEQSTETESDSETEDTGASTDTGTGEVDTEPVITRICDENGNDIYQCTDGENCEWLIYCSVDGSWVCYEYLKDGVTWAGCERPEPDTDTDTGPEPEPECTYREFKCEDDNVHRCNKEGFWEQYKVCSDLQECMDYPPYNTSICSTIEPDTEPVHSPQCTIGGMCVEGRHIYTCSGSGWNRFMTYLKTCETYCFVNDIGNHTCAD